MSSERNRGNEETSESKGMVTQVIRALSVWNSPRLGPNTKRGTDIVEDRKSEYGSEEGDQTETNTGIDFSSDLRERSLAQLGEIVVRHFTPHGDVDGVEKNTQNPEQRNDRIQTETRSQILGGAQRGSSSSESPPLSHGVMGFSSPHQLALSNRGASSSFLMPSVFAPHLGQRQEAERSLYGETEASVRFGRANVDNITRRETKRQSGRFRDMEYQRRLSSGSPVVVGSPQIPLGGVPWPREESSGPPQRIFVTARPGPNRHGPSSFSPAHSQGASQNARRQEDGSYFISLVCEGQTVRHQVWPTMAVSQLIEDSGAIFGLYPENITLILFSGVPETLHRDSTLLGPPVVVAGTSVMVFNLPLPRPPVGNLVYPPAPPPVAPLPLANSKLLGTFKLPKFDGTSKNWKTWDRAFQRFLGLHQLDHVLEDGFLHTIWNIPEAKEANKMVFFLLEDAVAPGSLASKYIRQAAKWNGHEAYVLLHDGYVFSGPQTATILLGELSNLRLKRDENASVFCLRLVELIEDLETIPGTSAVFLTEQQKLGYLLSAIRHEASLRSVYVQLQSEQLRGTVTFDIACRELHFRCEAIRADEFLDSCPGKALMAAEGKALISTEGKKKGQDGQATAKLPCLTKDCIAMIQYLQAKERYF
jgi:hypothetical protein